MEYVDGASLYRGYFDLTGADSLGLFGVFFGGTDEGYPNREAKDQPKDVNDNPSRPGNIAIMSTMYADDGGAKFYRVEFASNLGAQPKITGIDKPIKFEDGVVSQAKAATCDYVCGKLNSCDKSYVVDLFGWSRGAIGAVWLAELLNDQGCKCDAETTIRPVKVRFMGLLDAVATQSLIDHEVNRPHGGHKLDKVWTIPKNVEFAFHEQRDGSKDSDGLFGDATVFPRQSFYRNGTKTWPLTHGQVGRNKEVRDHLIEIAESQGVKFNKATKKLR